MLQKVSLEQSHELALSAEMLQGIHVFALSATELSTFVQNALQENPFLQLAESPVDRRPEETGEEGPAEQPPLDYSSVDSLATCITKKQPFDALSEPKQRKDYPFEQYFVQKISLEGHLEEQIRWDLHTDGERAIADYLIENIDDDGYLLVDIEETARRFRVSQGEVLRILSLLQACQPAGIAARTLQECLKIQLTVQGEDTELSFAIVENHLEDIAAGRLPKIASHLGVSVEEVQETVDVIRMLNPRPGSVFGEGPDEIVFPELELTLHGEGFHIELLDANIPDLALDRTYIDFMQSATINQETKTYLSESFKAAKHLMKSIERRRTTLFAIASCIMEMQPGFLSNGPDSVRPLTMHEVAECSGMSEATVSRMVNGNYIRTPHGVFELRAFFSSSVGESRDSTGTSSSRVKQLLRHLINEEDKKNPLSDARLVELLAEQGIRVSRRAVNKYRNALGIPGSTTRQRY